MPKESSLAVAHRANGAEFLERDGWVLPAHFGDVMAEYRAVRQAVGMLDRSHRALLQFTGPDRLPFLQGMLSNDLRGLKTFDGQHAALLTQQGKVVADVRVLCAMNSFYLDFWEFLKEKVLGHLNRYLIADEVEIADRSEQYGTLSLQGPKSEALLRAAAGAVELPRQHSGHAMMNLAGEEVCAVAAGHSGELGFDLIVPQGAMEKIARVVQEAGRGFSARWVGEHAQEILRIEAGIPRYGVDFSEENLLLETGLDHAVSFNKGCYLGQEVIERIRSRGHVNKKLCGLVIEGGMPAGRGDPIAASGKSAGSITSSVASPHIGKPIALGYVSKEFWSPGTQVTIHSHSAEYHATITALPFARLA